MNIIVCKNYDEMSKKAASIIIEAINDNPHLNLGLATGSSPIGTYKEIVNAFDNSKVSFKNVKSYNLDEYVGISKNHPQSYYAFMNKHLFKHIDIQKSNIFIPSGDKSNTQKNADNYNELLNNNQRDIQLLGIGANGHIGFNEPLTPFGNETFIVKLGVQTRKDNSRFFKNIDEVPKNAITMGIKNIMYSKRILLIAAGLNKAWIINEMINGDVTKNVPASILQLHPNCTVILDEDAASQL